MRYKLYMFYNVSIFIPLKIINDIFCISITFYLANMSPCFCRQTLSNI